jgi:hypothetical protein
LSTRGRSLCVFSAPGSFWKVFQLVWANFEQFGAGPVTWGSLTTPQAVRCVAGGLTAWWWRTNHPGQCEQLFALCCIPVLHCCSGVNVKSAPHVKHTASWISWLHTRGPGVKIQKRASKFSLKLTKDEKG